MKVRVQLDENKIVNRYLIFQMNTNKPQASLPNSNFVPVSGNFDSFAPQLFSTPTLNFELPKIDTSGC